MDVCAVVGTVFSVSRKCIVLYVVILSWLGRYIVITYRVFHLYGRSSRRCRIGSWSRYGLSILRPVSIAVLAKNPRWSRVQIRIDLFLRRRQAISMQDGNLASRCWFHFVGGSPSRIHRFVPGNVEGAGREIREVVWFHLPSVVR